MCEKPISPNGNEKDTERERARGHLSCVAVRDTVARQRHGGRLDRETSSPGTTAPGVSHRRGGGEQRLGRASCEVHLCDVMHAHFYHDS